MSNNYDEYENDSRVDSNRSLLRKFIVILLIVIVIVIIFLLLRGCDGNIINRKGKDNDNNGKSVVLSGYEKALVDAAKNYYNYNNDELPDSIGECKTLKLEEIATKGLVNRTDFEKCDTEATFVKVCLLENKKYQYTPWLSCSDDMSESKFDPMVEGSLDDILTDSTYIEFRFLPEMISGDNQSLGPVEEMWKSDIKYSSYKTLSTTAYYRYRDKLFTWNVSNKYYYSINGEKTNPNEVKEYYTSQPSSKYPFSDSKTTEAYKWYTTTSRKEYALDANGAKAFSSKQIDDYIYYDNPYKITAYRSRTVTGTYQPYKYYMCSDSETNSRVVLQQKPCGESLNPTFTVERGVFYSCVNDLNSDSIYGNKVPEGTTCKKYSGWTAWSTAACDTSQSDICESQTKIFYNWYKLVDSGDKTYYPSGSSTASGEKAYYTSAPVNGAVNEQPKATAYKWYYTVNKTTSEYTAVAPSGYASATRTEDYKWTDWSSWSTNNPKTSDGRVRNIETKYKIKLQQILSDNSGGWTAIGSYVTEEEMIRILKEKGYNVESLDDINNNGEIRYQVKMYIRNKKESAK